MGQVLLTSQASVVSREATFSRSGYLLLVLDVTATPNNAETLQLVVEVQDPASGKWVPIYTSAALAATTFGAAPTNKTTAFVFDVGVATGTWSGGSGTVGIGIPSLSDTPRRARVVQSAGGSWTYTLAAV